MTWDLNRYEAQGYCVIEPFMRPDDLDRVSVWLDAVCRRAASDPTMAEHCVFERDQPKAKRGGIAVDATETAVFIIGDLPRWCPEILPLLITDDMISLVAAVLRTSDIVAHLCNLTVKSPRIGSGINWHRDYPNAYISPVAPAMMRLMICVDGMTGPAGATCFLAGSHAMPGRSPSSVRPDEDGVILQSCAPGAVVAIHPLVLHGGGPNTAATPRRNIVVQWGRKDVPLATHNTESITGRTVPELRAHAILSRQAGGGTGRY